LNGETQKKVKELLIEASENGLICGRSPVAMVGAIIYIASLLTHQKRTQAEIASVANVTEVTIRNRYKELKSVLEIDKINTNEELANIEVSVGESS
jgi:transcription initiation factor TFIIB